jgi:hypothetical protein
MRWNNRANGPNQIRRGTIIVISSTCTYYVYVPTLIYYRLNFHPFCCTRLQ